MGDRLGTLGAVGFPFCSWLKTIFLIHLSSPSRATPGGAVSQFFCVFSPFLVDEKQQTWFFLVFFSLRHLPKPLSKSCQWQSQFHLCLKHIFVAAGPWVAKTTTSLEIKFTGLLRNNFRRISQEKGVYPKAFVIDMLSNTANFKLKTTVAWILGTRQHLMLLKTC